MKQDAEEQYNDAIQRISNDSSLIEFKIAELNNRRNESLEAAQAFYQKIRKQKRKKTITAHYWKKTEE